jgi:hypothetical protein
VFKVSQTRFLSNGEKDGASYLLVSTYQGGRLECSPHDTADEPVWSVPVGIITEKKKDVQFYLISQKYTIHWRPLCLEIKRRVR